MTTATNIERPESTLSTSYKTHKGYIKEWQKNNKEYIKSYNRDYQRKLRSDPVKFEEIKMRVALRSYLLNRWRHSYKVVSNLGITREQLLATMNMNQKQFNEMMKTHEIDHILSTSWFNKPENKHLKPMAYRHYNIQIVPKKTNRCKHSWVDENDIRFMYVKTRMELDLLSMQNDYSADTVDKISKLSSDVNKLYKKVIKKYGKA